MSIAPVSKWLIGLYLLAAWSIASPQEIEIPVESGFGNPNLEVNELFDKYRSFDRDIPLDIYNDQIGIQVKLGATEDDVLNIAAAMRLQIKQSYYRGIYHFDIPTPLGRKALTSLTRQLESEYPDLVKVAGLVVQAEDAKQPWLIANKISAGFDRKLDDTTIEALKVRFSITDARFIPGCKACYIMTLSDVAGAHVLEIADELRQWPGVAYSHPSFVVPMRLLNTSDQLVDPALSLQWHHFNEGIEAAIRDADIDSAEAWRISTGSINKPLLAIVDSSFANDHPDLKDNVAGVRSFNIGDPKEVITPPQVDNHGTGVAGVAAAVGDNNIGGKGVCPDCEMLLLRHDGAFDASTAGAICYAILNGADVISNSWAPDAIFDDTKTAIVEASDDHDIPVLFAMDSDTYKDNCNGGAFDFSSLDENVIAVSSVTDKDNRTASGFGNCADVLASTAGGHKNIVTTNVLSGDVANPLKYGTNQDFGGTSAATPMVTGTIGLMLDVSPNLTRYQIQRALQDTADKVDPKEGHYDSETGFSQPTDSTATHAFGRINTFEAVSLVAPFDPSEVDRLKRGHGGKDLLLRDHALDWGNTINPSSEIFTPSEPREEESVEQSVDIKVDVFPYQNGLSMPHGFVDLVSEDPVEGKRSRVYVRVRNRGPEKVLNAILKLHWTIEHPLPQLQADFWAKFPDDPSGTIGPYSWNPLQRTMLTNVHYSGASAAGCPNRPAPDCPLVSDISGDLAKVVVFDIPALDWNQFAGDKLSLLAVVHSGEDPVLAKLAVAAPGNMLDVETAVAWDNNVALWVAAPCSETWIKYLIIFLVILAVILIIYIVRRWPIRVRRIIYVVLIIVLIILLVIWIRLPCYFALVFN